MSVPGPGKLDATAEIAANAVGGLARERWFARHQAWQETKVAYPPEWRDAADNSEFLFYLTPQELKELNVELIALLRPQFRDRLTDPSKRPPGAVPVELLTLSYPIALPQPSGGDDPGQSPEEPDA